MKKGYTVIELLVTFGVMTILLSIGTLSFLSIRIDNQVDLVAAQIRSELLRVQSEATNHIQSGVYFESDRFVYFLGDIYVEDAVGNEQTAVNSGLSLSEISLTDNTVTFDNVSAYLENYTDPSQIIITGPGTSHTIIINKWGTISIE